MSLNYSTIGKRIKAAREGEKLSQVDLAALLGVSVTYISLIENAKKKVSLELIVRAADALGVTVDELIYGSRSDSSFEYASAIELQMRKCDKVQQEIIYEIVCAVRQKINERQELI